MATPAKIPASVKVAMGDWLFELPLWVEKGPKVVFQLFLGGREGMEDVTGLHVVVRRGEERRGRRGMTRGGYCRDASGGGTAGE
ncbi:hypothetical protein RHMOL_Rhmol01G0202700 [Rhododendron molle]|uniref:Uncharacterized protein n=1 Tax=Rhododendron molle TaxID=49168 RepID=A0ACC0Q6W7_RHOML|nr:hypothetical protein RHMOL_Rhmol01G0202700 [Rhododendron molle]